MKFLEKAEDHEDLAMVPTWIAYTVLFAILFGLVVATVVISIAEQNKLSLILGNGIFLENQGNGRFLLVQGNQTGTMSSNIPIDIPIGLCYQLVVNETAASKTVILDVNQVPLNHCE